MKRGVLYILLLVLLLPSVTATLAIEGPTKSIYNLGNQLDLEGFVVEPQNTFGTLKLNLVCESQSLPLFVRTIQLQANKQQNFKENLPIPQNTKGACIVQGILEQNNQMIEQANSKSFEITSSLQGEFKITQEIFQLGQKADFTGTITRFDSVPVNGIATLILKKEGVIQLIDTVQIKDNQVTYVFDSSAQGAGSYTLSLEAIESYGNQQVFENVALLTLRDELVVPITLNAQQLNPKDTLKIKGTVTELEGKSVSKGKVFLTFLQQTFEGEVKSGSFDKEITIPEKIKSGAHEIEVLVKDLFGNFKLQNIAIQVIPKPTTIQVELSHQTRKPDEILSITPVLYDQANDIITAPITLEIKDTKGESISKQELQPGQVGVLTIPTYGLPGVWRIDVDGQGVKQQLNVEIQAVKKFQTRMEKENLIIKNTGNIKIKEPLVFLLKSPSQQIEIVEKIKLDPGQEDLFALNKYVEKEDIFTVSVGEQLFENVALSAKKTAMYIKVLYWIFILLFVIFLMYVMFHPKTKKILARKSHDATKQKIVNAAILKAKDPKASFDRGMNQYVIKQKSQDQTQFKKGFNPIVKKEEKLKKKSGYIVLKPKQETSPAPKKENKDNNFLRDMFG